jgi:hypothetical protein
LRVRLYSETKLVTTPAPIVKAEGKIVAAEMEAKDEGAPKVALFKNLIFTGYSTYRLHRPFLETQFAK